MSFFSRLSDRARKVDSLLCVGLDPHPEMLARPSASEARQACLRLVEATQEMACAYKPNSAFFEVYGAEGMEALRQVIAAAAEHAPVILDGKRGDIASTARAYAQAAFQLLGADALTVSPYLGRDAVEPFLEDAEKGVFLLCRTTNPGASSIQEEATVDGEPLYLRLAREASGWSAHDNLGLVIGATAPNALAAVRAAVPDLWILAPGIGAQGGDAPTAVHAGLREDGLGLLLSTSRALALAPDPEAEALRLRDAINRARSEAKGAREYLSAARWLADSLFDSGCVRFGEFTLRSGIRSPIYFDLRQLISKPELLRAAAAAYLPLLKQIEFDRLAAVPYAALPIATAISLQTGWPVVYPRKEVKGYGTGAVVEGGFRTGETVVVVDDVATGGESKREAIERLEAAGLVVRDVVVLIDRQGGACEALARAGYRLHAAYRLTDLVDRWLSTGRITPQEAAAVRDMLSASG